MFVKIENEFRDVPLHSVNRNGNHFDFPSRIQYAILGIRTGFETRYLNMRTEQEMGNIKTIRSGVIR